MEIMMIIVAIIAACLTYFISFNLKKGAVMASAIVTLCSGIFLPYFLTTSGATLATVATTASYAAMVSQKKFPKITDMIFVGIICGTLFGLVQDVYLGVGGKLGTMAAISGFTWLGIKKISEKVLGQE